MKNENEMKMKMKKMILSDDKKSTSPRFLEFEK